MKRWFLAALLCFAFAGFWWWSKKNPIHPLDVDGPPVPQQLEFYTSIRPGCPSEIRTLTMEDPYLRGKLEPGSSYQAAMNYYQCHAPEKGDLVLYRFSWKFLPVAREIVGVPGDHIALRKSGTGWELWINGKVHKSGNQKFIFGVASTPPPLQNYAEANKGLVLPNQVLILASFPPGDKDSSVFGAVELGDIVAKISHN